MIDVYKRSNFAASDRCAAVMHSAIPDSLPLTLYVHSASAPQRIKVSFVVYSCLYCLLYVLCIPHYRTVPIWCV